MTDDFKAFNQMTMVCEQCYKSIKQHHDIDIPRS